VVISFTKLHSGPHSELTCFMDLRTNSVFLYNDCSDFVLEKGLFTVKFKYNLSIIQAYRSLKNVQILVYQLIIESGLKE